MDTTLSPLKRALVEIRDLRAKLELEQRAKTEPIALIGIGCRFPGDVVGPASFWELLRDGRDAIVDVPADRWDKDALFDADPDAPGKMATRRGGFLSHVDLFDAELFGITPREAASMDPQQRLLLEVSWEALEDAGLSPHALRGSDTGVFVGIGTNDYLQLRAKSESLRDVDPYLATGTSHSAASGRLAFFYGLEGPCLSVDTACSSSLVATHLALQSLRARECSLALVGGVNAILTPELSVNFSRAHMLAPDGRCKTFDDKADGYVRGEGCGVVVLKRLSDALRSGDRVYALLRGSATNQDGRSSGLTVPNGTAQEALLRQALRSSGVSPNEVGYVEAHGTGTSLGDPIELRALGAAYGEGRDRATPLRIGSVKANIGHLEAASGIAGLIKATLALAHEAIPRQLNFDRPSSHVSWEELPLAVATDAEPWPRGAAPRLAGVSSFGFSGTNAHVILAEPPAATHAPGVDTRPHLLALSARSDRVLHALAKRYTGFLSSGENELADVCFTAGVGRAHFDHRLAVVADTAEQAGSAIERSLRGEISRGVFRGRTPEHASPKLALLFTGQGSQHFGMGRALYENAPVYRQAFDRCEAILEPMLGAPLSRLLYGESGDTGALDRTGLTQPALFAYEWSLLALWRSWGVEPDYVAGHSLGEYVAAASASVLDLETALRLVYQRGRLMESLPEGGAMAAVFTDEASAARALSAYPTVAIASVNGPRSIVLSGPGAHVDSVTDALRKEGVESRKLTVSHAFHSCLMDPALDAFEAEVSALARSLGEPRIDLVSNLTGRLAAPGELSEPGYWRRQLRETVRFADTVETLRRVGVTLFVEVGPSPVLCGIGSQTAREEAEHWLPSSRRGADDRRTMLESAAVLYVNGASIAFDGLARSEAREPVRISVPTYPFDRERHWLSRSVSSSEATRVPVERSSANADNVHAGGTLEAAHSAPRADALLRELEAALPSERLDRLVALVREELARVMKIDGPRAPGRLDRLKDRGLDSLMAVELRNRLGDLLGIRDRLPATLVFENPTPQAIAELLARELEGDGDGEGKSDSDSDSRHGAREAPSRDASSDRVRDLSEDEMEALLLRKLESL